MTGKLRFSIRALLVLIGVVAIFLGWFVNDAQSQKRGREWVASENGHVTFSRKYDPATQTFNHQAKVSAPTWLVDLLGIDFFDTVRSVILDNQEVDDLQPIVDIKSLRILAIMIEITDNLDFAPLKELPNLERLYLSQYTHISEQRLAQVRKMLPDVRVEAEGR